MTSDGEARQVVLVGVDGSPESVAALVWASHYAAATGTKVRAVRAWHYPSAFGEPEGRAPEAATGRVERGIRKELTRAVAKVYPDTPEDQVEMDVRYGHPARVLIDESKDASLLVVGHRGYGAFTGMLIGSVSTHCVTSASCPVVVVRGD